MADGFDFSEVVQLSKSLGKNPAKVITNVRKAVEVSARNVKDDARSFANFYFGNGSAADYSNSIDYNLKGNAFYAAAEIGPRPGGQGDLAPLFETGNPFSGRKPSLEPALENEAESFIDWVGKAVDDSL